MCNKSLGKNFRRNFFVSWCTLSKRNKYIRLISKSRFLFGYEWLKLIKTRFSLVLDRVPVRRRRQRYKKSVLQQYFSFVFCRSQVMQQAVDRLQNGIFRSHKSQAVNLPCLASCCSSQWSNGEKLNQFQQQNPVWKLLSFSLKFSFFVQIFLMKSFHIFGQIQQNMIWIDFSTYEFSLLL